MPVKTFTPVSVAEPVVDFVRPAVPPRMALIVPLRTSKGAVLERTPVVPTMDPRASSTPATVSLNVPTSRIAGELVDVELTSSAEAVGSVPAAPRVRVPEFTVVVPEYVFAPLIAAAAEPDFTSPFVPPRIALTDPPSMSKSLEADRTPVVPTIEPDKNLQARHAVVERADVQRGKRAGHGDGRGRRDRVDGRQGERAAGERRRSRVGVDGSKGERAAAGLCQSARAGTVDAKQADVAGSPHEKVLDVVRDVSAERQRSGVARDRRVRRQAEAEGGSACRCRC